MIGPSQPDEVIALQAAEWAVLVEYGDMTADRHTALDAWLAGDRRHRGAFLRARACLYQVEDAVVAARLPPAIAEGQGLLPDNDNEERSDVGCVTWQRMRPWHWAATLGGAALLASGIGWVVSGGWSALPHKAPHHEAGNAIVPLADGSVATLGNGALIEPVLSANYRRVRLIRGRATFKVAPDSGRPFIVQSGDVYAQATGTIYSVSRVGQAGATVKVTEGAVLVWTRDEPDEARMLRAGGELTLQPHPQSAEQPSQVRGTQRPPPPELAQIVVDNESIASTAARFNRVNSTKIVIADKKIAETRIVGLFRANEPERFAEAAAAVADGVVDHGYRRIVIKMK